MNLFEKICNKIWPKFQQMADRINSWDYDPETKKLLQEAWDKFSPALKAVIMAFITKMIAEYGPDKGKEIFDGIMTKIYSIKIG